MKNFKSVNSIKRKVRTFLLLFSLLTGVIIVNTLPVSAQLSDLTSWYKAMNSTDGNRVSLFSNDVSYLMANNAIWCGTGLILGYPEAPKPWKNSYVKKMEFQQPVPELEY